MRKALFLLPLIAVACGETASDQDALSANAAADTETLARTLDETATELAEAIGDISSSAEYAGIGDCVWTVGMEGSIASGVLSAEVSPSPCGGSVTGETATVDVSVTSGSLTGTWTADLEGWTVEMSGSRSATTTIEGPRRTRTVDTTWSVDSLEAFVNEEGLGSWSASVSYGAGVGEGWSLEIDGTGTGTITGTLSGPGGASCTVSGTVDAVDVTCDSPRE